MSSESDFWSSLKAGLKYVPNLHINRIESSCTPGFPDIVLCYNGAYALLELKVAKSNKVLLTNAQIPWHKIHEEAKGNHWLLYKNKDVYGVFKVVDVNEENICYQSSGNSVIKIDSDYMKFDRHLVISKDKDNNLETIYKRIIDFVCKKKH